MSPVPDLGSGKFPRQSRNLGKRVTVCYLADRSLQFTGVLVRDDADDPSKTIVRLDDGRHLLSGECIIIVMEC